MNENIDIDALVADRKAFNEFVYTPLSEAMDELNRRKNDLELKKYVAKSLPVGIPPGLENRKIAMLPRYIGTPNYEIVRFLDIVDLMGDFESVIGEYTEDKFTSNNELKHALGKIGFHLGYEKDGSTKVFYLNVIDFNQSNGKKISDIKTLWGQQLIDFHHDLFDILNKNTGKIHFLNMSDWFSKSGNSAKGYYQNLLSLFLQNGILLENFLTNEKEVKFTKEILLPALIKIRSEIGTKPLIVAVEPTEMECDRFWVCYPPVLSDFVKSKLQS